MRGSSAIVISAMAILAFIVLSAFAPLIPAESDTGSQEPDALITQSGSTVTVTYKNYLVRTAEYSTGSDIVIFDFGSVDGSLSVVFDGADVGDLTLFNVKQADDFYRTLSVDFIMKSGSVRTFSLISVDDEASSAIDTSYDRLFTVFRNVNISISSGSITEVCPTYDMLAVSSISYDLGYDLSVDRFYPTGINGKYTAVCAVINGSDIGYITNISSRIGSIEYDIRSGSVSYLCIGANTEHNQSDLLVNKSTFLATGDVKVHIGPLAHVYRAILGGGISNIPRIICNGESYSESVVHNVTIDADGTEVSVDTAFFHDSGSSVYSLSSYELGRSPSVAPLSEKCTFNRSSIDVYGAAGIWESPRSAYVTAGVSAHINAELAISSSAALIIQKGGYLSNSGFILLSGSLYNYGRLDSSGVIQCSGEAQILGTVGGRGIVADAINYPESSESVSVMVSGSAASIIMSHVSEVSSVSALLEGGYKSVSVSANESHVITGDRFVLGISPIEVPVAFQHAYRLEIIGIDSGDLAGSTVKVTLETDNSKCTAVYVSNGDFYDVVGTSQYASSVTFDAGGNTVFYTLTYDADKPPIPVFPTHFKLFDYVLIALIVALGVTILYVLYRMRRKNDA